MRSSRFPVSVDLYSVSHVSGTWYERARTSLLCLRCRIVDKCTLHIIIIRLAIRQATLINGNIPGFSYHVYYSLLVFVFPRYFFHSELLEPVMRPRTAVYQVSYCGDGFMGTTTHTNRKTQRKVPSYARRYEEAFFPLKT